MSLFGSRTPFASQREFLNDPHRYCVIAGNRAPGKTTAVCWRIMDLAMRFPNNEGFIGRWIKKDLFATTLSAWKDCYPPDQYKGIYEFKGGTELEPDYIKFGNGTLVHLLPLENRQKIRGGSFGFFFIDQMEECPQEVWSDCVKVLRRPVWHTWTDAAGVVHRQDVGEHYRFGWATVNKNRGWYWIKRLFEQKRNMTPETAAKYHLIVPRWDENERLVKEGYYDDIRTNAKSQAEIDFEVYGKDPSEFGLVFPDFDRSTHLKKFEFTDLRDAAYMIGYDEGYDVPSCFLFVAITPDETIWVRAEHYAARMTITQHQNKLHEIAARIGFPLQPGMCRYVADRAIFGKMDGNGISIADQWGQSWPWQRANKDISSGFSRLRELITLSGGRPPRFFVHPDDCPNTTEELEEAYYDEEKPGHLLKRCKDHALDVLRYIAQTAQTPMEFRPPANLDGTWTQFRDAEKKGKSFVMGFREPKLFVPRRLG